MRLSYNFYVYVLTNRWRNVLYVGVTNDLVRRLWQHRHVGRGFANRYNCDRLVYVEWYDDIRQAIDREKQLKAWSRTKKDALITAANEEWDDLSAAWAAPEAGDSSLRSE